MEQVKVQSKVIAFAMTMVMALAITLAFAPAAFAVDWNSNVTVTAMGKNGTYTVDSSTHTATITPNSTKTESGQYVEVTMQFKSTADLSGISATDARDYLLSNTTIAGRSLTSAAYNRDIFNVAVDNTAKTITFDIAYNTAGMTANYNGKLYIAADGDSNFSTAMGDAEVETLIGTGVAIADNDGTLSNDNMTKTFTISSAAYNRGMVHVLILDGDEAIFDETGTFSNGGLTVHAHTFDSQTVSDFAEAVCTAGNSLESIDSYEFNATSGGTFEITNGGSDVSDIRVYIYDCNYLNSIQGAVGDITEREWGQS